MSTVSYEDVAWLPKGAHASIKNNEDGSVSIIDGNNGDKELLRISSKHVDVNKVSNCLMFGTLVASSAEKISKNKE